MEFAVNGEERFLLMGKKKKDKRIIDLTLLNIPLIFAVGSELSQIQHINFLFRDYTNYMSHVWRSYGYDLCSN